MTLFHGSNWRHCRRLIVYCVLVNRLFPVWRHCVIFSFCGVSNEWCQLVSRVSLVTGKLLHLRLLLITLYHLYCIVTPCTNRKGSPACKETKDRKSWSSNGWWRSLGVCPDVSTQTVGRPEMTAPLVQVSKAACKHLLQMGSERATGC